MDSFEKWYEEQGRYHVAYIAGLRRAAEIVRAVGRTDYPEVVAETIEREASNLEREGGVKKRKRRKMVWYEDYHRCYCSNIQDRKADLLGYCARHGTSWKHRHRIPDTGFERGQVGS